MAKKFDYKKYIVYISFVIVLVVFSVLLKDKGFLSYGNMMNILRQTAMISVAAVGMTFAISAGLIDLSTGSVVAISALVTALALRVTGWFPAVLAGTDRGKGKNTGIFGYAWNEQRICRHSENHNEPGGSSRDKRKL